MAEFVTDEQMAEKAALDTTRISQHTSIDGMIDNVTAASTNTTAAIDTLESLMSTIEQDTTAVETTLTTHRNTYNNNLSSYQLHNNTFNNLPGVALYKYSFTMFGDINTFYPLPFKFHLIEVRRLSIYRGLDENTSVFNIANLPFGAQRIDIVGSGGSINDNVNRIFNIENNSYVGTKCISAISKDLYCTNDGAPIDYCGLSYSGMYLRGGINYTIETDDPIMLTSIQQHIDGGVQSTWLYDLVYVASPISDVDMGSVENDPALEEESYIEGRKTSL